MEKNKLFNPQDVNHSEVINKVVRESSPRQTLMALVFFSSVIATLGLLNGSPSVVIGAMLVSPLLWPILGVSMGALVMDFKMLKLSLISIFVSVMIAVTTAVLITFFYVPLGSSKIILEATNFTFMFPVAIAAGAAAAFALSYEHIKEAVTGVAISEALLPPLVSIGIGLGSTDWSLMMDAIQLFLINLFGIITIALFIFAMLGFGRYRKTVASYVKKEEKILKSE
ncbi:hypothetical protein CO173_02360 [Candidatus Uhrbacteria bacterium CG_4_9_14_3_um_filter_41_35]|uniref:TIGR00341 family protein n=1 Tax=Candidatus Uhrbacteria bacterium CG_4_9_14_3_um_filter_41_35 TaxID=1975034 RepID=A0A2M7XFE8_9BACT|nr:MAG: hypothetical protein COV92_01035 [Candidatus Uhrbacteria bacterium CG11_big_fil_rev_8_21_14_0_20_41_9]PJA46588.1 MAG: hypothetical protein CO173_02360 [Candidatus Uhrbacteria bacterium CG_4_9_14_3_um_filter_41_35]